MALYDNGTLAIESDGNAEILDEGSGDNGNFSSLAVGDFLVSNLQAYTAPTFQQNVYNKTLSSSTSGGQISITPLYLPYQPTVYLVTVQSEAGLYYFMADGLSDSGGLTPVSGEPANIVATAVNGTTVYVATETEVYS